MEPKAFNAKRLFSVLLLAALGVVVAKAGGLMTNTNYHIAFDRMFARGTTSEIDATFSNPAGLVWGHEGWQLSLDFQKPWQNRDIETTVGDVTQKYPGEASAPIVPALFASYKKDKYAVSAMLGIVGSGGYVEFEDGIPMFNVPLSNLVEGSLKQQMQTPVLPQGLYSIDSNVKGKQYIYGGQVNFSYRILDCLSAAVGARVTYYDGYNRGYVTAKGSEALGGATLANLEMDCEQRGWGFAPVISLDYHKGPLTLAARYDFRTKINVPNDTKELVVEAAGTKYDLKGMAEQFGTEATVAALGQVLGSSAGKVKGYLPDVKTRYDMPSLLVLAAGYEITPKLRAAVEYHFYDDRNAKMADNRQDELSHGTSEFLLGAEFDINKKITVSCGGQRTDYGLTDSYQQNTSFACDSWSVGAGAAVNLTEKLRLNVSYFCTLYSDYTKETTAARDGYDGKDVYSRTNNVIGVGIDYKF